MKNNKKQRIREVWTRLFGSKSLRTLATVLALTATATAQNNAKFFSQKINGVETKAGEPPPEDLIVYAGMPFEVELVFENTGENTTWTTFTSSGTENYSLGSQLPTNNTIWNTARIPHPSSENSIVQTPFGARAKFHCLLVAPKDAGEYLFQWRLTQKGATPAWFGGVSPRTTIKVELPPRLDNAPLIVGYQGWYNTDEDGFKLNWKHWFTGTGTVKAEEGATPKAERRAEVDMWPDTSEYIDTDPAKTPFSKETPFTLQNDSVARVFSNAEPKVVDLHFKWMRQNGIDGAFVGRFASAVNSTASPNELLRFRDKVLENALEAASVHTRKVSIEYDLSTGAVGSMTELEVTKWLGGVYNDWVRLVNAGEVAGEQKKAKHPNWLTQNGLPVLRIYGLGFNDVKRPFTAAQAKAFLLKFRENPKYNAFIVGGVPSYWATNNNDARSEPGWRGVYAEMDMLAPWTVGRYKDDAEVTEWAADRVANDIAEIVKIRNSTGRKIGYLPYIFPGFSWSNLKRNGTARSTERPPYNQIPRRGGKFMWKQAYEFLLLGNRNLGIAMFDEMDEGTAIFKVARNRNFSPIDFTNTEGPSPIVKNDYFVNYSEGDVSFAPGSLPEKGVSYSSDWYLKVAGKISEQVRTLAIPTTPVPQDLPLP